MARELGASLQEVPSGARLVVRCDIEPIVQVRQILTAAGWEIIDKVFLPAERGFTVTARQR